MAGSGRPRRSDSGQTWPGADEACLTLVVSRFHGEITGRLARGAERALVDRGVAPEAIGRIRVPGAWELPLGVMEARRAGADGAVALGCVIRGQTPHFDYVCQGATDGLMAAQTGAGGFPVGFGLLTCDDEAQARDRAGGSHGNKGAEAAEGALEMLLLRREEP